MYVLIIVSALVSSVNNSPRPEGNVITFQEFTSKEMCLAAQNSVMMMAADSQVGEVRSDCVEK